MSEANKDAFRRYMQMWVEGNVADLEDVIAPGYVGHSGADPGGDEDIGGLRHHIAGYSAAFPGVRVSVDDQVAEGDRVATRMTARLTDPETGEERLAAGFNISRFADGKLVEEWALWERP